MVIIVMSEMAVYVCEPAAITVLPAHVEAWIMISTLFSNIPSHTT